MAPFTAQPSPGTTATSCRATVRQREGAAHHGRKLLHPGHAQCLAVGRRDLSSIFAWFSVITGMSAPGMNTTRRRRRSGRRGAHGVQGQRPTHEGKRQRERQAHVVTRGDDPLAHATVEQAAARPRRARRARPRTRRRRSLARFEPSAPSAAPHQAPAAARCIGRHHVGVRDGMARDWAIRPTSSGMLVATMRGRRPRAARSRTRRPVREARHHTAMSSASAGGATASSVHTDTRVADSRANARAPARRVAGGAASTYTAHRQRHLPRRVDVRGLVNTAFTSMGSCIAALLPGLRRVAWAHTDPISPSMTKLTTVNDEP